MGFGKGLLGLLGLGPAGERSASEQQRVDAETRNLSLYQLPACPYCFRVRRAMRRLRLNIELRNAASDPGHKQALIYLGGRYQAPCLRIEQAQGQERWLYESSDIIRYLRERFAIKA
jgi:glutathione S-transferase